MNVNELMGQKSTNEKKSKNTNLKKSPKNKEIYNYELLLLLGKGGGGGE